MSAAWTQVKASSPCPICGKGSKCAYTDNAVICHRVPSDRPRTDEFGHTTWLHRLKQVPYSEIPDSAKKGRGSKSAAVEGPFVATKFTSLETGSGQAALCKYAGEHLGVDPRALMSLDMRWCPSMKMAVVPMKSYDGTVVGMNGRHFVCSDGTTPSHAKQNAPGSVDGLFLPLDLDLYEARLVICEGASDTAAAISLGLRNAIGRSSCRTGVKMTRLFCERRRINRVTVVADRDAPTPEAPEGVGVAGAMELAAELGAIDLGGGTHPEVTVVTPPEGIKDLRDWAKADRDSVYRALTPANRAPHYISI